MNMKNLTCPLCCNAGFSNREDLRDHLQKVTTKLNCPFCMVSCKNVVNLIKHLDVCNSTVANLALSGSTDTDLDTNSQLTDNDDEDDDDDVEGYFCTVCDIKIPDVYKHIQQFHNGQEVILQDDDEDSEGSRPTTAHTFHSDSFAPKRKPEEVVNGASLRNKKPKSDSVKGEAGERETFYCSKCNVSFLSLTEHASKYHQKDEVLVQDIAVTDLFPESKRINNSWCFSCSCCQKTIARKATLAKHLKLSVFNKSGKNEKAKSSFSNEVDGMKLEAGTEYEIEEVKLENYDFDSLGRSIF